MYDDFWKQVNENGKKEADERVKKLNPIRSLTNFKKMINLYAEDNAV